MRFSSLSKNSISQSLIVISLLVLLVGCGTNSQGSTSTTTPIPTDTPTSTTPTLNTSVMQDAGGLHIESLAGIGMSCPSDFFSITPNTIVLAQDPQQNYDTGEIQQIESYLNSLPSTTPYLYDKPFPDLPNTLQQVPVSLIGHIDGWNLDNSNRGCIQDLKITNTSNTAVQLTQVNIQLTTASQSNQTKYNLINVCMQNTRFYKIGAPGCPSRPSAKVDLYQADFNLQTGNADTVFQGQLHPFGESANTTGSVTLQPQDSLYLILNLVSSENLIYSLAPILTVDVAGAETKIRLPEDTIAFATADQFSCYDLQGMQFVALQQVITADTSQTANNNTWCL